MRPGNLSLGVEIGMTDANSAIEPHLGRKGRLTLRHGLIVGLSAAAFAVCLTQTAYISPGVYFDQLNEIPVDSMKNSAISQLLWGWLGIPFALFSLFHPNPLVGASVAATGIFAWRKLRVPTILAACFAVALMWRYRTLGLASWLANPLLVAAWICCLLNRCRVAAFLSGIALTLILGFPAVDEVPFGPKGADVPVLRLGGGYWLWLASAAIAFAGAMTELFLFRKMARTDRTSHEAN